MLDLLLWVVLAKMVYWPFMTKNEATTATTTWAAYIAELTVENKDLICTDGGHFKLHLVLQHQLLANCETILAKQ